MDDFSNYIYIFGPVCWALLAFIGGLVATVSPNKLRQARTWFILSAIPLFAVPITYGWVGRPPAFALTIAAISGAVLGVIYCEAISALNEHIKNVEQEYQEKVLQS